MYPYLLFADLTYSSLNLYFYMLKFDTIKVSLDFCSCL